MEWEDNRLVLEKPVKTPSGKAEHKYELQVANGIAQKRVKAGLLTLISWFQEVYEYDILKWP